MISILMPAKNAGLFIDACIQSVLCQSYADWELIVIDDHSTDCTAATVEQYAQRDPRIRLFQNTGDGILPALRLAQSKMSGEFVTRMDADDLMPEDKLKILRNLLLPSSTKRIVTGKVSYFSDDGVSAGYLKYQDWLNRVVDRYSFFEEIYRECTIASPNWMMRIKDFLSFGGFDRLRYPEDYDMLFQLKQSSFQVVATSAITHLWRDHSNRASRDLKVYQQEMLFELKLKYFLTIESLNQSDLVLWGAGRKGKLVARKLLDGDHPFTWIDWDTKKFNTGIYGKNISPMSIFSQIKNPLVINTVTPPLKQQQQIDLFAKKHRLLLGQNYFVF